MIFNCKQFLSSKSEILSFRLTFHIIPHLLNHLADLIVLTYLTDKVSSPYNIKLSKQVKHILPFTLKGKSLPFKKVKKSINLLHQFLIPAKTLSHPFKLLLFHQDNKTSPQLHKINHLVLCPDFPVLSWFPVMLKSNI